MCLPFRYHVKVDLSDDVSICGHAKRASFGLSCTGGQLCVSEHTGIEWTDATWNPVTGEALDKVQGFTLTEVDRKDAERQFPQLKGQFLVDRDGIVRWLNVECATEGLAGLGKFPTEEELVEAARALPRR